MIQAQSPGPVSANEKVARFVTVGKWIRADQTIRQDAFVPPKDLELSVTRHLKLSEDELWNIGQKVAEEVGQKRSATLHGRADITASQVFQQNLKAEAAPRPANPNHAHITGWPSGKSEQKNIAQELAVAAGKAVLAPKRPV